MADPQDSAQPPQQRVLALARQAIEQGRSRAALQLLSRLLRSPSASTERRCEALLLRAGLHTASQQDRRAWRDLSEAHRLDPDAVSVCIAQAELLARKGLVVRAFLHLSARLERPGATRAVLVAAEQLLSQLPAMGLRLQLAEHSRNITDLLPIDRIRFARMMSQSTDYAQARLLLAPLLERQDEDGAAARRALAEVEQSDPDGRPQEALARITSPQAVTDCLWLAEAHLTAGQPEQALSTLLAFPDAQADPAAGDLALARVRLLCRLGRSEEAAAIEEAHRSVSRAAERAAVISAVRGQWEAVAALPLEDCDSVPSRILHAEALRRLDEPQRARAALADAQRMSRGTNPSLLLNRVMLENIPLLGEHCLAAFAPMRDASTAATGTAAVRAVREWGDSALDRLGGARDRLLVWSDAGGVHIHQPAADLRTQLARFRESLRVAGFRRVHQMHDRLEARQGTHPLICTYRAELLLWEGRYEEARAELKRALELDPRTRWAWVGLAIIDTATGEFAQAVATLDSAKRRLGMLPSAISVRAEALLRLDRVEAARKSIRLALSRQPTRLSVWIVQALLELKQGGHPTTITQAIQGAYPALWAASGGDSRETAEVLNTALELMLGNRSSSLLTWRHPDGMWMLQNMVELAPLK